MGSNQATIENIILTVLASVIILILVGCLYAFTRAIFLFIFSQGKEDKITAARNSIRYMIIGIIMTVLLLFIFPLIFRRMNVKGYENYSAKNIFNKAGTMIQQSFKLGDIIKESQEDMKYRGQFYYESNSEVISNEPESVYNDYSL